MKKFRNKQNLATHKKRFHSAPGVVDHSTERSLFGEDFRDPDFMRLCYDAIAGTIDPKLLIRVRSVREQSPTKFPEAKSKTVTFVFTELFKKLAKYGYFSDLLGR